MNFKQISIVTAVIALPIILSGYTPPPCTTVIYEVCVPADCDPEDVTFMCSQPGRQPMLIGGGGGGRIKGREVAEMLFFESLTDDEQEKFIRSSFAASIRSRDGYNALKEKWSARARYSTIEDNSAQLLEKFENMEEGIKKLPKEYQQKLTPQLQQLKNEVNMR